MAHQRSILCGIASGLLALAAASTGFGAGVIVVTHGYHLVPGDVGSAAAWLNAMANGVERRGPARLPPSTPASWG
jgi:hypothetical protein